MAAGESAEQDCTATVLELLPSGMCRVELANREQVLVHPASATVLNTTRLRPGDKVRVALSPHDQTRGRIVKLLKP